MKKSHLTREQRYEIQAYLKMNVKPAEIARQLGKGRSVISREIKRNRDVSGKYRACYADEATQVRKERFARSRKLTPQMEVYIADKIKYLVKINVIFFTPSIIPLPPGGSACGRSGHYGFPFGG